MTKRPAPGGGQVRPPYDQLPERPGVVVEVSRGGRVKWNGRGGIDYLSPFRSPFNYGAVPGWVSEDGEPVDAVVLGPRLPRGASVELPLRARVRFVDGGKIDDKWVCAASPLVPADLALLRRFFARYARIKLCLGFLRLQRAPTRFEGIEAPR